MESFIDGRSVGGPESPVQRAAGGWARRWGTYEDSARPSEGATAAPRCCDSAASSRCFPFPRGLAGWRYLLRVALERRGTEESQNINALC